MRNKTKCSNTFPPPLPSSWAQLYSDFSLPPLSERHRGQGMWAVISSSHVVTAAPSSSHSSLAPVWGSSHGRQFFMNCSSLGPSHGVQSFRNRLLQCESPAGSQDLSANLLQHGLLSPWVHMSRQKPVPAQAPHRVTASFRHPPAPAQGPFHGLQVEICSTMDLHGLQGHSLPHGLQGNLCSGAWSTSSHSFFTDLGVCRVVSLTYILTPLSRCCSAAVFSPLPNCYPRGTTTVADGLGLG